VNALSILRRPGRSWPAEHSVALRATAAGSVCIAIAACAGQGELSGWFAAAAATLVVAGSAFSYRRRTRPLPYLKVLLGGAMLGAFAWFFVTVSADAAAGQLSAVEGPLAVLFSAMQAAHAFDMPSRRDLGFSLAGSATLMAVAGAQAIDLSFSLYVALWAAIGLAGLHASWSSMVGGSVPRPLPVVVSTAAALLVAAVLVVFLPSPQPPELDLGSALGGTSNPSVTGQPARVVPAARSSGDGPASAAGRTGVGGFLGFAGPLDTALRPGLGDEVVLRVRADRPTYWVAQTYDAWSGRSWTEAAPSEGGAAAAGAHAQQGAVLTGGSPFVVGQGTFTPAKLGPGAAPFAAPVARLDAQPDYQTFYLAAPASNLVLHADQATAVWIPTRRLYVGEDGTIRTGEALGAGSVYSVVSTVATPSDAALATANGTAGLTARVIHEDLQLPEPYRRVAALARRVTARDTTVVSKVESLEHWIGVHTRYTLDIPPLAPGQDSVVQFLFGSRKGFCEQISTSLAVMLRTLGIPARETVGYVPGPFDPITGLYDEEARDAHAWVQVWFPGYGWQSFDPTAYVPTANPSTASTIGNDVLGVLRRVPVVPAASAGALLVVGVLALVWRRRRPRTWSTKVTRELERAARRAGLEAGPGATLASLAAALDDAFGDAFGDAPGGTPGRAAASERGARALASVAAGAAWGGEDDRRRAGRHYVHEARRLRRAARHDTRRRRAARPGFTPSSRGGRARRRTTHPRQGAGGTP
jgi:protein-glutamine gamma-glutamyltransferase